MNLLQGNLIELAKQGEFDVIVHGCNCYCKMGAGIAKFIKEEWPKVFAADLVTRIGDLNKLGTCTTVDISAEKPFTVVNAYTQFTHWEKNPLDYDALYEAFKIIKKNFGGQQLRIGYPLIGCGLANGNWNIVEMIIDKVLEGEDHTLVYLTEEDLEKAKK